MNVARNEKNIGKAHSLARLASAFELVRRYDYVCLMDADTQVSEDYFQAVTKSFAKPGVAVVCGRAKSTPHNWLTAYRCLAYWISHAIYKDGQSNMGVITVTPGCAAAFRSDAFAQLDWSNDTIVEDMDCTIQVHRKKLGKIVYQKHAVVSTQDPRTLRDYIKQMYRWHTGAWQVGQEVRNAHRAVEDRPGIQAVDGRRRNLRHFISVAAGLAAAFCPRLAFYGVGMDMVVLIFLSMICAVCDRRSDVCHVFAAVPAAALSWTVRFSCTASGK